MLALKDFDLISEFKLKLDSNANFFIPLRLLVL